MKLRAMRTRLAGLARNYAGAVDLRDLLVFGGLAAIGYGVNMIYPPAAWIVCGAVLFWLGVR